MISEKVIRGQMKYSLSLFCNVSARIIIITFIVIGFASPLSCRCSTTAGSDS